MNDTRPIQPLSDLMPYLYCLIKLIKYKISRWKYFTNMLGSSNNRYMVRFPILFKETIRLVSQIVAKSSWINEKTVKKNALFWFLNGKSMSIVHCDSEQFITQSAGKATSGEKYKTIEQTAIPSIICTFTYGTPRMIT